MHCIIQTGIVCFARYFYISRMVFQMQQIQYQFSVIQASLNQINHGQSLCTECALNNSFDPLRLPGYGHVSAITGYQKNYIASLWPSASLYVIICKSSGLPNLECECGIFLFLPFLQIGWFVLCILHFLVLVWKLMYSHQNWGWVLFGWLANLADLLVV